MLRRLGDFFRKERTKRRWSLGLLARQVGYRNASKGCNKICKFEREGVVDRELLVKLARALDVTAETVNELIDADRQAHMEAWERWVNTPVPMRLIVKYIPGVYGEVALPESVTTSQEAEDFACEYAKQKRQQVCLAVSRRLSIWIDQQGIVTGRTEATPFGGANEPYMQIGNKRFLMNFGESKE